MGPHSQNSWPSALAGTQGHCPAGGSRVLASFHSASSLAFCPLSSVPFCSSFFLRFCQNYLSPNLFSCSFYLLRSPPMFSRISCRLGEYSAVFAPSCGCAVLCSPGTRALACTNRPRNPIRTTCSPTRVTHLTVVQKRWARNPGCANF